jgi:hypothetical protein
MEAAVVHPDWVRLTNLRQAMLWKHDLPDTAYLPWCRCQEVMRCLKQGWEQEPRNVALKAQLHERCSGPDAVQRTMTSRFRTAMFERFGGVSWATWYSAIGDLPEDVFKLANAVMADRISNLAGRQPRAEGKHPEPRLSKKRALAASQGRIVPEMLVQHVVAQASRVGKPWRSTCSRRRRRGTKATPG